MKHTTRLIAALLCLVLTMPAIVACAGDTDTSADTTAAPTGTTAAPADTTLPVTEPLFVPDALPEKMDFKNEEVTILTWKAYQTEFNIDSLTGDIVEDALFNRVQKVEERLNIKLNLIEEAGDWSKRNDFIAYAAKSINAGDGAYDLVAHYSLAASIGAMQHLYQNLNEVPHLDFEKPWWPGDIVEASSIGNKVYFATGDVAPTVLYNIFGVYFNEKLIKDNGFESPYDLVEQGKWTFDKMQEMAIGQYQDLNANQKEDIGDRFGLVFADIVHVDPFYYSAGLTIIGKDSEGSYALSEDFASEKTATWCQKLCSFLHNNPDVIVQPSGDNIFQSGQSLFLAGNLNHAASGLRDVEFTYGLVPMPKYDAEQDRYYSVVGMPYSMYTVPVDVKDSARAGALLEALASEAYRSVSPAIFETAFKVKYAESEQAADMYDLIRNTLVYDVGRTFGDTINVFAVFRNAVRDNNPNWSSLVASNKKAAELRIKQIVEKIG